MMTPNFEPDSSQSSHQLPNRSQCPDLSLDGGAADSEHQVLPLHGSVSCADGDRHDYEQAMQQVEAGDYGDALTLLNRAVTLHAYDYQAWTLRGVVLVCLSQYEAAIASCDRALMIQPEHSEAWKFRGLALHGLNRYREAYQSYDRALGIQRRSPLESTIHWLRQRFYNTTEPAWYSLDALP